MAGKGQQEGYANGGQTRGGRVAPTPIGARPSGSSPLRKHRPRLRLTGAPAPKWKCRKEETKAKKAEDEKEEEEDWDEEPEEDWDDEPEAPEEPEEGDGRWVRAAHIQENADACDDHALDMEAIADTTGARQLARGRREPLSDRAGTKSQLTP